MSDDRQSILIEGELTQSRWDDIMSSLVDKDDIKVNIINAKIIDCELTMPSSISGLLIESSIIHGRSIISGLERGRFLVIKNCTKSGLGYTKIENVFCNSFEFVDKKHEYNNDNVFDRLQLDFKECGFEYFNCFSMLEPLFNKVFFIQRIKISPSSTCAQKFLLHFDSCRFGKYLQVEFRNCIGMKLSINDSSVFDEDNQIGEDSSYCVDQISNFSVIFNFIDSNVSHLAINKSILPGSSFYLFCVDIKRLEIYESIVGALELYTLNDKDKPKEIYSVQIKDSAVDRLLLNNRIITHPIDFSGSEFYGPPNLLGVDIPHGSLFPGKSGFINRSGEEDASCYRVLRHQMESQRNRELEGMFFILEQESILNSKSKWVRVFTINWWYAFISCFGTNYVRPICFLILSIFVFTVAYALILSPELSVNLPVDTELLTRSFVFSLKQVLQPFSALKELSPLINDTKTIHMAIIFMAVINSAWGVTCLALSALAISWKFKRG